MNLFRKNIITIIGLLITIFLTFFSDFVLKLSADLTWITFIIGAIITITATLLKLEINERINLLETDIKREVAIYSEIYEIFKNLRDENIQNQLISLFDNLKKGEIPSFMAASRTRYLIRNAKQTCYSVYPVREKQDLYNWLEFPRHRSWLKENYEAISRGVKMERTYILKKNVFFNNEKLDEKALEVFKEQMQNGIKIRIAWFEDLERSSIHVSVDQTFTIIDGVDIIHDEGKGNNRIYRKPSVKVQEFNEVWSEYKKYSSVFVLAP